MRRSSGWLALAALGTWAGRATAQTSQFGARGLGLPLRALSVQAGSSGGAFGLFDQESALNPASIGLVTRFTASFQTVQDWLRSTSPSGSASVRDNRFPGLFAAGPIGGTRLGVALSVSGYTDRNFALASQDTITLRGEPVAVSDTLKSQGGISDLRAAIAWRQSRSVQWGLGLHLLTGSNRIASHRVFSDSAYTGVSEGNTISYLGVGISLGVVARAGQNVTLGATVRIDDRVHVERDTSRIGSTNLPVTLAGGVRIQLGERLRAAGSAAFRNWSVADADLVAQGGVGSRNTLEFAGGIEFLTDPKRPRHHPIRLGIFHAGLPFSLRRGEALSETGIAIGTSQSFVADRAELNVGLSRVWRRGGSGFSERAMLLNLGVTVRP